jgi:hypothetical protein
VQVHALAPVGHHVEVAVAVAGEDVVRELVGALDGDHVECVPGVVKTAQGEVLGALLEGMGMER